MKLVVGLGNPGRKYQGTRHNVGFIVVEELARRYATGKPRDSFGGELVEATVQRGDKSERVLLLCPHTFMNRSGRSVAEAKNFYKLEDNDLLVICDDLDLPTGKLRFRAHGSSGGQRGMADIIKALGTDAFARLRFGIGRPPEGWDVADYVLSSFSRQERDIVEPALVRAADGAEDWVLKGIEHCMNQYNAG